MGEWRSGKAWLRVGFLLLGVPVVVALLIGFVVKILDGGSSKAVGPVTVNLVTSGGIDASAPFADVHAAILAAEANGSIDLRVPGLERFGTGADGLGARTLLSAEIQFPSVCADGSPDCLQLIGEIPLDDLVGEARGVGIPTVPITIDSSWFNAGLGDPVIAFEFGGADTSFSVGEGLALARALFPELQVPDGDIGEVLELDGVRVGFRFDPNGDDFVDVRAATAVGAELEFSALFSVTVPNGGDPFLVLGFRADSTVPGADRIRLDALLRGNGGNALAADLELPEFALGTAFPAGVDVRPNCPAPPQAPDCMELRQFVRDFFDDPSDPDDGALIDPANGTEIAFPTTLQLGAKVDLDTLGDEVQRVLGYDDDAQATLLGDLGISVTDLVGGEFTLDSLQLEMTLPGLNGAAASALPDWFSIQAASVVIEYGSGALVVNADVDAEIEIADESQAGGVFTADIDANASLSRNDDGDLAVHFDATSDNDWVGPFGIDWLTLTGVGVEMDITHATDAADPVVTGGVSATFDLTIGEAPNESTFSFGISVSGTTAPLSLAITMSLEDQISLEQVLDAVGIQTPIPDSFAGGLKVGPASLTIRVGPGEGGLDLQLSFGGSATVPITDDVDFTGDVFFGFEIGDGADPKVTFGVRTSAVELADLIGSDPFGVGQLPTFGFVGVLGGSPTGDVLDSNTLTPEAREFFSAFGCTTDPTCSYRLDLSEGAHFLSALPVPEGFQDVAELFWINADAPSLIDISIPLPAAGNFSLDDFSLKLSLPEILPPEEWEWISRGRLSVEVTMSPLSFTLAGELDIRFRDDSVAPAPAPSNNECTRSWLRILRSDDVAPIEHACYQELTLEVSVAIELGGPPTIAFEGAVTTPSYGWPSPFGLDFLSFTEARLRVDIAATPSGPSFGVGVLAAGSIFEKDFSGSLALGFSIVPAPTPAGVSIVPEFRGIRFASQAGIGTDDLIALYDLLDFAADFEVPDPAELEAWLEQQPSVPPTEPPMVAIKDLIGFDPPASGDITDELAIPSVSFRNIEFMLGLADLPSLCIEPGLRMAGELHVQPAATGVPPSTEVPPACAPSPVDPTLCNSTDSPGCFASVLLNVTFDGIIISGSLSDFTLPPVITCDQTLLDFRMTLSVQRLQLSGGCDVSSIGSAGLEVRVGFDGIAFSGDIELFPDSPGSSFSALVEGEALIDYAAIDISEPASLLAADFNLHIALQADFIGALGDEAEPILTAFRTAGIAIDDILTELDTSGDPLRVLEDLADTLERAGVGAPPWLADFSAAVTEFRNTLEFYALAEPEIDDVLGGFDVPVPGVEGFYSPATRECRRLELGGIVSPFRGVIVDGECYTDPPGSWFGGTNGTPGVFIDPVCYAFPGIVGEVDGDTCWAIEPGELHVPGLSELTNGLIPPSLAAAIGSLESEFTAFLQSSGIVPDGFSLEQFRADIVDQLRTAAVPLLAVPCADIGYESFEGSPGSQLTIRLDFVVLGHARSVELLWDFSEDPADQLGPFTLSLVRQLFEPAGESSCRPFGITSVASGGAGTSENDPTGAPLPPGDFSLAVSPSTVDEGSVEGGVVTATVVTDRPALSPVAISIDWGDGSLPSMVEITTGTTGTATHRYSDDAPSGTASDTRVVTASGLAKSRTRSVSVANVAPSAVVAAVTPSDEGSTATLTGSFADQGLLDVHTVRVRWGDGSTTTHILPVGTRTFAFEHIYTDDDPIGTDRDTYSVRVDVTDDDLGTAVGFATATVDNVAPTPVSLVPVGGSRVTEDAQVEYDVMFIDPGAEDRYTVTVDWRDGVVETYTVLAAKGGPAPKSLRISHRYRDDDPSGTASDTYAVVVTVRDDDLGSGTASLDVLVENVAPRIGAANGAVVEDGVGVIDVQYSDPLGDGDGVTVVVTDVAGDPLTSEIKADNSSSTEMAALLGSSAVSCAVDEAANTNTCVFKIGSVQSADGIYTDIAPGVYVVQLVFTDDDLGETTVDLRVTVHPEDARVWYVGPLFAATESAVDGDVELALRATIRDITSVMPAGGCPGAGCDPAWDPWPGDIRNASVTFETSTGDPQPCSADGVDEVFDPFDVFSTDRSIGVSTCDWTSTLGSADSVITEVSTVAGAYYTRDHPADLALVTTARPLADFISGGGYLVAESSAGVYASDRDSHANFGLNVKFNKKRTNLQGNVNLIVRSLGRIYQIKSNAIDSLGIYDPSPGVTRAEFESKANVIDITDPANQISLGGNLTLRVTMTDGGDDDPDTIAFTLWDNRRQQGGHVSQLLLYSSRWTGDVTEEQGIAGGNFSAKVR